MINNVDYASVKVNAAKIMQIHPVVQITMSLTILPMHAENITTTTLILTNFQN